MEELVWKDICPSADLNDQPTKTPSSATSTDAVGGGGLEGILFQDLLCRPPASTSSCRCHSSSISHRHHHHGHSDHGSSFFRGSRSLSLKGQQPAAPTTLNLNSKRPPPSSSCSSSSFSFPHHLNADDANLDDDDPPASTLQFSILPKKRVVPENDDIDTCLRSKRMIKNRESAARSRARKQAYTNELEIKAARLLEENAKLRRQQEKLTNPMY